MPDYLMRTMLALEERYDSFGHDMRIKRLVDEDQAVLICKRCDAMIEVFIVNAYGAWRISDAAVLNAECQP